MKAWKELGWQYQTTGVEGDAELFGVPIFAYSWKPAHRSVTVVDPVYHQTYRFSVYTVTVNGQEREFAAGEFSNGIWGFFCPGY